MSKKYLWISLFAAAVLSANSAHATGSGPGHQGGQAPGHHFKPHFNPHQPQFGPRFPGPHRPPPHKPPAAVPELSAEGALAALALLMGVATMLVPRARRGAEPDSFRT
jgi:hypothetical protein